MKHHPPVLSEVTPNLDCKGLEDIERCHILLQLRLLS